MTKPRVLITGGYGFLGQAIVRRLLARDWSVRILARRPSTELTHPLLEFFPGDISDTNIVNQAVQGCDHVIHVAAKAGVWGPMAEYERINVQGTQNLLVASQRTGVQTFVHTSTPSVVFNGEAFRGDDESLPYGKNWLGAYAPTKARAEQLVLAASQPHFRVCALRPHLIWGPGDPHIFPRLLARARSGRLRIIGQGNNLVDVTHVDTAADAHVQALDALLGNRANGKAYFISQGQPVILWDFINALLRGVNLPPVTKKIPLPIAYSLASGLEASWKLLRLRGEPPMTRFVTVELAKDHWFNVTAAQRDLNLRPAQETWSALETLAASLRVK
jgi:nucleoside-diphosphate-sugar epimerase